MSKITFAEDAWDEYLYWQTQDKRTLRKINQLLKGYSAYTFFGRRKARAIKRQRRRMEQKNK